MAEMKAVRFDRYGGGEVLEIRTVVRPEPEAGRVLVQVMAASINPGEAAIRNGLDLSFDTTVFLLAGHALA